MPSDVIKIITDRNILPILYDLGEFYIYNKILNEEYEQLLVFAYKILKYSTKERLSKNENDFINSFYIIKKIVLTLHRQQIKFLNYIL